MTGNKRRRCYYGNYYCNWIIWSRKEYGNQLTGGSGYYCIDNIPPALIKDFVSLSKQDKMRIEKAAFVVDIRGGEFFGDLKESLHDLDAAGMKYKVLFLEASNEILIRRFKETRRTHPLATAGNTLDGIEQERERLQIEKRQICYRYFYYEAAISVKRLKTPSFRYGLPISPSAFSPLI